MSAWLPLLLGAAFGCWSHYTSRSGGWSNVFMKRNEDK